MSDLKSSTEFWQALKAIRQMSATELRRAAIFDFPVAERIAKLIGLELVQRSEVHYQIKSPVGWIINVYPGNRRIYHQPKQKARGPFFDLPSEWDLFDVLEAIARH